MSLPDGLDAYVHEEPDGSFVVDTAEKTRERREAAEAAFYHDQDPGRWGDEASPARMRRDVAREREEDQQ